MLLVFLCSKHSFLQNSCVFQSSVLHLYSFPIFVFSLVPVFCIPPFQTGNHRKTSTLFLCSIPIPPKQQPKENFLHYSYAPFLWIKGTKQCIPIEFSILSYKPKKSLVPSSRTTSELSCGEKRDPTARYNSSWRMTDRGQTKLKTTLIIHNLTSCNLQCTSICLFYRMSPKRLHQYNKGVKESQFGTPVSRD